MKICVLFPGIGYTTEMPLMYYPGKMTLGLGYEHVRLKYKDLPSGIKGNKELIQKAFDMAYEQSMQQLKDINWSEYSEVLFIGKSIGTAIAAKCGQTLSLNENFKGVMKYVFMTPLEETFYYVKQ